MTRILGRLLLDVAVTGVVGAFDMASRVLGDLNARQELERLRSDVTALREENAALRLLNRCERRVYDERIRKVVLS